MALEPLFCLHRIVQTIFDKKGFNILVLDLRSISGLVDYVVIAEGYVGKHVTAIGKEVMDEMAKIGLIPFQVEGLREGDWVALDFSSIVVHLFLPSWREKYQLEALWREAAIVDIPIDTNRTSSVLQSW